MVEAVGHVFFSLFSDSKIVSHSPFTCNWQNRFLDSELIVARFLSNIGENLDIESHATLQSYNLPHLCLLFTVCMGWVQVVCQNKIFCLLFF